MSDENSACIRHNRLSDGDGLTRSVAIGTYTSTLSSDGVLRLTRIVHSSDTTDHPMATSESVCRRREPTSGSPGPSV